MEQLSVSLQSDGIDAASTDAERIAAYDAYLAAVAAGEDGLVEPVGFRAWAESELAAEQAEPLDDAPSAAGP